MIITKIHNNYCSVGLMELCLLNLLILINCFLCNSYPCVLFESLSHVINQESHVYSWNLGKIYLVHFLEFWNLPCFTREISKFQKSELSKFIPNFPFKHVITSTKHMAKWNLFDVVNSVILKFPVFWNFPLMICNFPLLIYNFQLLFSHSKNIWMSTWITIIITY